MRGVLLLNLGSPDGPTPPAVGRYLREFLMDPHVITLPAPLRWLLVNALIVPTRKYKSAEAYAKIWGSEGSPLVAHSRALAEGLAAELGGGYKVELGMRYGNPSIESALASLKYAEVDAIAAVPLYPQYAASSTETAVQEALRAARGLGIERKIRFADPFYAHKGFVRPFAAKVGDALAKYQPEHLLFSYHGLPIRAIETSCGRARSCLGSATPCPLVDVDTRSCYRAHCYATTKAVVDTLGLKSGTYSVGFQSRLTSRWIQPFSDALLEELAKRGVQKLLVACPSFVADCLETLEEIEMRARADFRKFGGKELRLVPALNSDPAWVKGLASILLNN